MIIEEPPSIRTIFERREKPYRIPFPYMVYIISFVQRNDGNYDYCDMCIGFGKKPIQSVDSHLLSPRLPHMNGNNPICMPISLEPSHTIHELASNAITLFWNTRFIYPFCDWDAEFKIGDDFITSFSDWQNKVRNPLDILNGDFKQGNTISEVIQNYGLSFRYDFDLLNQMQRAVSQIVRNFNLSANDLNDVIKNVLQKAFNDVEQNFKKDF